MGTLTQIVFENLEGVVRRGWSRKERQLIDCVQSDVRAFGVGWVSKATTLGTGVRTENVTEQGRGVMAVCRKEGRDPVRHRQEQKEGNDTGKCAIVQASVEPPKQLRYDKVIS